MTMPQVERTLVMFSLQRARALLGEVFPALRAVSVEWTPSSVKFFAYVDGPIRDDDAESLSCVSAEVAADFWDGVDIDYEVVRCDAPARIDDSRLRVFERREVR